MRQYAIGALLLDLHQPEHVIAELTEPLLEPDETDHNGNVANVVYSCGGLVHDGVLWLPYDAGDNRVSFATIPLAALLAARASTRSTRLSWCASRPSPVCQIRCRAFGTFRMLDAKARTRRCFASPPPIRDRPT